jgi:hypothetical protein
MAVQPVNPVVEEQARLLAAENRRSEPDISRIFWFPDEQEVRLVEIMEQVPACTEGEVQPFYFRPAPQHNLPAPSGIAMIRADEFGKLRLPQGWGDWGDAVEL